MSLVLVAAAAHARPAPQLAVSILAADQMALGAAVDAAAAGGARSVHVDVMDGHFVPNLAYGPDTVRALRAHTRLWLDVHLMVEHPDPLLKAFADAGADSITVHVEACDDVRTTVAHLHELHVQAGVAINPETPLSALSGVLDTADRVMLMSVHPGFGGQKFIPETMDRLRELRGMLPRDIPIEMDGGIDESNIGPLVQEGVDIAVCGSAVFHQPDPTAAAHHLIDLMTRNRAER